MTRSGLFVSLEGVDGAGKTYQVSQLEKKLKSLGYDVYVSFEPGSSSFGDQVKTIFANSQHKLAVETEVFLLMADRWEHYIKVIQPQLKDNKIVLLDRFIDSTFVYQGLAVNHDLNWLRTLANANNLYPDITFWLDIDDQLAISRINNRFNKKYQYAQDPYKKIEAHEVAADQSTLDASTQTMPITRFENVEFVKRVTAGYNQLYKQHPQRIVKIDGSSPPSAVTDQIVNKIRPFLPKLLP